MHLPLAYIDPGSGSLIIQAVIAGAVGGVIMLRTQLLRVGMGLKRLVSGRSERTKE